MSNKFQPGEEIFDEVTGHGISSNRAVEDEDIEGHAARVKVLLPEDEDTEGHGTMRGGLVEDEDTEGHAGSRNF